MTIRSMLVGPLFIADRLARGLSLGRDRRSDGLAASDRNQFSCAGSDARSRPLGNAVEFSRRGDVSHCRGGLVLAKVAWRCSSAAADGGPGRCTAGRGT